MPSVDASDQLDTGRIADEIDRRIRSLPEPSTESMRRIRREYSRRLQEAPANEVLAVADALVDRQRWVGYELLYEHPSRLAGLTVADVERLGQGLDGWVAVDTFARYVAGPAWQQGFIPDEVIHRWAASPDHYWRRAALVATVPLNLRAAGGHGDTIVKALSWALRELVIWDPDAVRVFLNVHEGVLAARVKREVRNKLDTGLKHPGRGRR